jgi:Tfp pilus assembly protein PilX
VKWQLMHNKIKNQKGSIMVTVIVILAILVVLGVALMDSSTRGFGISKHEETADMAYNAAESAIEKCFSFIYNFCSDQKNTSKLGYEKDEETFVKEKVIPEIKQELSKYTYQAYDATVGKMEYKIGLSSSTLDKDYATVEITDIKYLGWKDSGEKNKIIVTMGVNAVADYSRSGDKIPNRKIFSKREFLVYIPRGFELNAAMYTLGDIMVDNINAQVSGDIVAFGTSPEYTKQVQQHYYGGIYAKHYGHLSIYGNAYSRGLIRAGKYISKEGEDDSIPDNSSIYIFKDAIANGLHIFGKGDKIVVGRNAYTFDDLEMNGEDSVIAVNGSFVGLSGSLTASNHDESSAIVNSAVIHHAGSDLSKRSRIVINGDAILNGGTFRVENDGKVYESTPQIEDASVVTRRDNSLPMYRDYLDGIETGTITIPKDIYGINESNYYHLWLYDNRDSAIGFANLIQCWWPAVFNSDDDMRAWTNKIDLARQVGYNNTNSYDKGINTSQISGFCNYEIGANDRVYFMERGRNDISKINFINNGFILDNITDERDWESFWDGDGMPNTPEEWSKLSKGPIGVKLAELKSMLMDKTQIFAKREYQYSVSDNGPIVNSLNSVTDGGESANLFMQINDELKKKYPGDGTRLTDRFVFNLSSEPHGSSVYLNEVIKRRAESYGLLPDDEYYKRYFLIYNSNPAVTIHVNTKVNGIIYSLGQIIVEKDADVTGSIIAAGKGFTNDGSKNYVLNDKSMADESSDSAFPNYLPVVLKDGKNLEQLDNGSYAGIYFKGASNSETARVTFPGKDDLLQAFIDQDMDLYSIFDIKEGKRP